MELGFIVAVRVFTLGAALALCLLAGGAMGQNIALVISEETPIYIEIADGIRRVVDRKSIKSPKIMTVPAQRLLSGEKDIFKTDFYQLVVTVGAHAASVVATTDVKARVLNALIPRALYDRLSAQGGAGRSSAIYLDQPLNRQLDLARLVVPDKSKMCVIYGPQSRMYAAEFERLASVKGFSVVAETVDHASDLGPVLQRTLSRCEFLFALQDAKIFNRNTIHQILMTSYHTNDPVIALSAAQVKAGALAAVFSSPEQVALQTADAVIKILADAKLTLPAPQYPLYCRVSVNREVARSFALQIGDDKDLELALARMAEESQ